MHFRIIYKANRHLPQAKFFCVLMVSNKKLGNVNLKQKNVRGCSSLLFWNHSLIGKECATLQVKSRRKVFFWFYLTTLHRRVRWIRSHTNTQNQNIKIKKKENFFLNNRKRTFKELNENSIHLFEFYIVIFANPEIFFSYAGISGLIYGRS